MSNSNLDQPPAPRRQYFAGIMYLFLLMFGGAFMVYVFYNIIWSLWVAANGDLTSIAGYLLGSVLAFLWCLYSLPSFARSIAYGRKPNV